MWFFCKLKTYWKQALGFISIILGYFLYKRNENSWKKNYQNSIDNEKKSREVEVNSLKKQQSEKQKIEIDHLNLQKDSKKEIETLKQDLEKKKKSSIGEKSIAESIAELTGAEHVKKD